MTIIMTSKKLTDQQEINLKEYIQIIQRVLNGEVLETRAHGDRWVKYDLASLFSVIPSMFVTGSYLKDIRIKPKQTIRAFNENELKQLVGKVVMQKNNNGNLKLVIAYAYGNIYIAAAAAMNSGELLSDYTFPDGSPCGVMEEEKRFREDGSPWQAERIPEMGE
jgi:hypothetical protein